MGFCTDRALRCLTVLLLFCSYSGAQETKKTATVTIVVKGANGSVVVGAQAKFVSRTTGETRTLVTDGARAGVGVLELEPATYEVIVSARGFRPLKSQIILNAGEKPKIDLVLEVAGLGCPSKDCIADPAEPMVEQEHVEIKSISEPAEMLVTEQGFLAINSPKGWVRTDGPGLAYFVPPQKDKGQSLVWIYISSAPIGPNEEAKDLKSYIDSDKAAFKQRFRNGVVQEEISLSLPLAKLQAPVLTFRSGEKKNTVEQVVYVGEVTRVLTLVLSAREQAAFDKALPTFRDFAKSYSSSITPAPN